MSLNRYALSPHKALSTVECQLTFGSSTVYLPSALLKCGGMRASAGSYDKFTLKGSFLSSVMAFLLGKGLQATQQQADKQGSVRGMHQSMVQTDSTAAR